MNYLDDVDEFDECICDKKYGRCICEQRITRNLAEKQSHCQNCNKIEPTKRILEPKYVGPNERHFSPLPSSPNNVLQPPVIPIFIRTPINESVAGKPSNTHTLTASPVQRTLPKSYINPKFHDAKSTSPKNLQNAKINTVPIDGNQCPCLNINGTMNEEEIWNNRFNKWWEVVNGKKLESQQMYTNNKERSFGGPIRNDGDEKKPKWYKYLKKIFKGITCDYNSSDISGAVINEKRVCECGKHSVCGVEKKCAGYTGILEPCGEDCVCSKARECMNQHLELLCPCKPCYCSCGQHLQNRNILFKDPIKKSSSTFNSQHVVNDENCCSDDEYYLSVNEVHGKKIQKSIPAVPYKNVEQGGCCCICDEALCPCSCCIPEPMDRKMQTSRFHLKDNGTQTDKTKGKCCKCCRCCQRKNNCVNCPGRNIFCDDCGDATTPDCHHRQELGNNITDAHYNPDQFVIQSNKGNYNQHKNAVNEVKQNVSKRGKTLMVRTNSAQCIPETDYKETCCIDHKKSSNSKMYEFIRHLNERSKSNYCHYEGDLHKKDNESFTVQFSQNELKAITNAKLKTLFLEDGFYSSPLSGRNYDLTPKTVEMKTKFVNRNLPKLLDVNEHVVDSKYSQPHLNKCSDFEHKKLMTAVCEAILSNHDDSSYYRISETAKTSKSVEKKLGSQIGEKFQPIEIIDDVMKQNTSSQPNELILSSSSKNAKIINERSLTVDKDGEQTVMRCESIDKINEDTTPKTLVMQSMKSKNQGDVKETCMNKECMESILRQNGNFSFLNQVNLNKSFDYENLFGFSEGKVSSDFDTIEQFKIEMSNLISNLTRNFCGIPENDESLHVPN